MTIASTLTVGARTIRATWVGMPTLRAMVTPIPGVIVEPGGDGVTEGDVNEIIDDRDLATNTALSAAVDGLKNGAPANGDTLNELHARLAAVEALGSLATDAELIAAVAAILGTADTAGDTLGELQTLIGLRLLKSQNLADIPNASTALTNLGLTTIGKTIVTAADAAAVRTALDFAAQVRLAAAPQRVGGAAVSSYGTGVLTVYIGFGAVTPSTVEAGVEDTVGIAGVMSNFSVRLAQAVTGGTAIYTLRKNGADTAVVLNFAAGDIAKSDTTHPITWAATDVLTWRVDSSTVSAALARVPRWSAIHQAT